MQWDSQEYLYIKIITQIYYILKHNYFFIEELLSVETIKLFYKRRVRSPWPTASQKKLLFNLMLKIL